MFYRRRSKGLIWLIIVLLALGLLNFSILKKNPLVRFSRAVVINVLYSFQYATRSVTGWTMGGLNDLAALRSAQKENRLLKEELIQYKAKLVSYNGLIQDNAILRQRLGDRAESPFSYQIQYAEIISRSASNWFSEVVINKGTLNGVKVDMAVIAPEGLVGRIIEASRTSSKVLLITDPSSSVSVVDQRSRDLGIAIGSSMGPLSIKYVSTNADMKSGDLMTTSGMSGTFPRGVVVGKVISASKKEYDLFQIVVVAPSVKFSRLESVFVVIR